MRTNTVLVSLLTVAVTACGNGSQPTTPPDAAPDAPPDAPVPGEAISIDTSSEPDLIAFRDGAGPWQSLPINGNLYEIEVHGPYLIAVVCDDGQGFTELYQVARTPDDDREQLFFCFDPEPFPTGSATGRMAQAGSVSLGFSTDRSTTPDWDFSLFADDDTYELAAIAGDRFAIRRGVTIAGRTAITPPINLAQEGVTLLPGNVSATNATAGENVTAQVSLITENFTFVRFPRGPAPAAKLVPDASLVPLDNQRISVNANEGERSRSVFRFDVREASDNAVVLPEALGDVSLAESAGKITATWDTLPTNDLVDMNVQASSEDFTQFWFHDLDISPAYLAATGATSMTIDVEIPSFDPAWRIDFSKEYFRGLSAFQFLADATTSSTVSQAINAPPAVAPRRPLTRPEVRELRRFSRTKLGPSELQ